MAEQIVRFEQFFAATPSAVFAWFAEHENVAKLFPGSSKRIKNAPQGDDVNGLESVRELRILGFRAEETVTRFEPAKLIEYRVTQGWPIKNHVGRLEFEPEAGGTRLVYSIEFDSRLPFAGRILAGSLCHHWRRGVQRAVEAISGA